ncbi:MAG: hypothetical protein R6U96_15665 [Promethearchaeia archaeon]
MSIEQQEKLARYYVIKGLLDLEISLRESGRVIFNFYHPMSRVTEEIREEAYEISADLDLFYGDMKLYKLEDDTEVIFYEGSTFRLMAIFKPGTITEENIDLMERVLEKFLFEFESKYDDIIEDWNGDKSVFDEAKQMLFEYLNVDLTYPHVAKYRGFDPEEPLEQYIYEAADNFSRKIGYFYLDNLIYLTKELVKDRAREEGKDPDEVEFPPLKDFYLGILNLKKIGMLEKIDNFFEELQYYSKIDYEK